MFDLQLPGCRICAILNSPGSWGVGQLAADIVRGRLEAQWRSLSFLDPEHASQDLAPAVAALPKEVMESEDGCDFDAAILCFSGDECRFLAAGALGVIVFTPSGAEEWFRPKTILDEAVALGQLTIEEAEAKDAAMYPVWDILLGPWVGPSTPHIGVSGPFRLPREALLVVADTRMIKTVKGLAYSVLRRFNGQMFQDYAFSHGGFAGAVILGRTGPADSPFLQRIRRVVSSRFL